MSKLWRYNLHYFDFLNDTGRSPESARKLIESWIAQNPPQTESAWEPYTVSLRIVNWIKFFLQPQNSPLVSQSWLTSLYHQALWLERNIEYHILANHYLKNGKALFFAGSFFSGRNANRWRLKGLKILLEESDEQILEDGGHFERSPMYHSIVVEDYIDTLNILAGSAQSIDQKAHEHIRRKTTSALQYLSDICMPDGDIPLFNDSAFGTAYPPSELFDYAHRVTGFVQSADYKLLCVYEKKHSGYFVIRHSDSMIIIDCGPVGPDYQPGHAHCDCLSYELSCDGRRVIVDGGVLDYENGTQRQYARSTRAHNTVSADRMEQSEIWGSFRVGRRARPIYASAHKIDEKRAYFRGSHDGFRHLRGKPVHERSVEFDTLVGWKLRDQLKGHGQHFMESFLHFDPDLRARIIKNEIILTTEKDVDIATITVSDGVDIKIEKAWHFPEFGKKIENLMVTLTRFGALPLDIEYMIRKTTQTQNI